MKSLPMKVTATRLPGNRENGRCARGLERCRRPSVLHWRQRWHARRAGARAWAQALHAQAQERQVVPGRKEDGIGGAASFPYNHGLMTSGTVLVTGGAGCPPGIGGRWRRRRRSLSATPATRPLRPLEAHHRVDAGGRGHEPGRAVLPACDPAFNCGYGRGFSVREVLRMVEKVSGVKLRIEDGARRAGDAAELVAEPSRIRMVLSWAPRHDELEVICSTAYQWEARTRTSPEPRVQVSG